MRITPLEIRQHTFDKSFRGYDVESVDAFLLSLSQEWERVAEDFRQTKSHLEASEREIGRMKEIESSLFKTLKAAEDTQKEINANAKAEADIILNAARKEADELATEARKNANMLISDAESKSKYATEEAINELKNLDRDFKAMERYKDFLVVELRRFANDTLEKVSRFEEKMVGSSREKGLTDLQVLKESQEIVQVDVPVDNIVETVPEVLEEAAVEIPLVENIVSQESVNKIVTEITPVTDIVESVTETEIDFEPATEYDDEDAELPTVHAIVHELPKVDAIAEISKDDAQKNVEELIQEAKSTRGRPRKTRSEDGNDGLPTVQSVMEEMNKENANVPPIGGGSFFDSF
jgi:cell division initiation protein